MAGAGDLDRWADAQAAASRAALAAAVSAEGFLHERPEFGQTVLAAPGSVLASRVRARWDPAPDYSWHWVRDAAVVMRLAHLLAQTGPGAWRRRMADHVAFSLHIATRPGPAANPLRPTTAAGFDRFLRPDAELAALRGDRLLAEPRANIDGSPDFERWSRPQHDGPALRALCCLGWGDAAPPGTAALLRLDLDYTLRHAARPCIGPWEEDGEHDLHAFTLLAQRAALAAGAARGGLGAAACAAAQARIEAALDTLWSPAEGCLRGRAGGPGDAAVLLGVLLQPAGAATFGPADPRVLASILWLCDWSAAAFPVNAGGAPAIGRGPDDRFFGGNPWLPTTLGMAEIHFALASHVLDRGGLARSPEADRFLARLGAVADTGALARGLIGRGEAFLATLRRHAPGDGRLPEQIDRSTGAPTSCPDLTWSHAALISALDAREAARHRLQAQG